MEPGNLDEFASLNIPRLNLPASIGYLNSADFIDEQMKIFDKGMKALDDPVLGIEQAFDMDQVLGVEQVLGMDPRRKRKISYLHENDSDRKGQRFQRRFLYRWLIKTQGEFNTMLLFIGLDFFGGFEAYTSCVLDENYFQQFKNRFPNINSTLIITILQDDMDSCFDDNLLEHFLPLSSNNFQGMNTNQVLKQYAKMKRTYIERDWDSKFVDVVSSYFSQVDKIDVRNYQDSFFKKCFRITKKRFFQIRDALVRYKQFSGKKDATGRCISPEVKLLCALKQLATGIPAQHLVFEFKMGKTTALDTLLYFCTAIVEVYGSSYMKKPSAADVKRICRMHEMKFGFPGLFGSLDCTHWEWRSCPYAYAGAYQNRHGKKSIILEAVASNDLWIWHAFIGASGSNNDLNVLFASPLLDSFANGKFEGISTPIQYETIQEVNENEFISKAHNFPYLFVDGIYPEIAPFVKSYRFSNDEKEKRFIKKHEGFRKNVECCFGVLKGKWRIIDTPCRLRNPNEMCTILQACIILHNMCVEDRLENNEYTILDNNLDTEAAKLAAIKKIASEENITDEVAREKSALGQYYRRKYMNNRERHLAFRSDLTEHLWYVKRYEGDNIDT